MAIAQLQEIQRRRAAGLIRWHFEILRVAVSRCGGQSTAVATHPRAGSASRRIPRHQIISNQRASLYVGVMARGLFHRHPVNRRFPKLSAFDTGGAIKDVTNNIAVGREMELHRRTRDIVIGILTWAQENCGLIGWLVTSHVLHDEHGPAGGIGRIHHARDTISIRIGIIVFVHVHHGSQPDLFAVVQALHPVRLGFGFGQRRQEHRCKNRDDRNNYQQLNKSEGRAF